MTEAFATRRLPADAPGLAAAAAILSRGGLVAFPTETVYGLGGDARHDAAVARIFAAKGRPAFNPLIAHVADADDAERIARFDDRARRLAATFWPGPLTLVLPLRRGSDISPLVTAGLDSIALRVPAAPVAQELLAAFGGPVAAPSANPSGRVSPTRAEHVIAGLDGRIDAVIDGGACAVGVESTIVSLLGPAAVLRPGGVPDEAVADCVGPLSAPAPGDPHAPRAPGQLASHYAPEAPLRLEAVTADAGEVWIGFGPFGRDPALNLSPSGDPVEAAARLFHILRLADAAGRPVAVAPVPDRGLGRAINDRLRRAAAPRDP
jgi:L-threonylcarbamoyladenylate synthase